MPKISIIIPTYNEAKNLPLLLSDLSTLSDESEILIIDCGSEDKTLDIARIYGAKIFKSYEKNRGLQLSIGANNAGGNWFIFLHADSRLPPDWFTKTYSVFFNNEDYIYTFRFKVKNQKKVYRLMEIMVNLRCFFFKTPYGDQGLIIHRKVYFENNGYRSIPIMEDFDFIKRLKKRRNIKILNSSIYINSRKWEKTNIFLQAFKNWKLRMRWLRGESINSIYKDYYKIN